MLRIWTFAWKAFDVLINVILSPPLGVFIPEAFVFRPSHARNSPEQQQIAVFILNWQAKLLGHIPRPFTSFKAVFAANSRFFLVL